jgi:Rrf2 family protein
MLRISDAANLAFHAMLVLSTKSPEEQVSVQELSKKLRVSDNHLSKVMQRLSKAGLVGSRRGPAGGFHLVREPSSIRLSEIYTTIEGPIPDMTCLLEKPICEGECCLLGTLLSSVQRQIRDHLVGTTLQDVRDRLSCLPGN